jgi:hypothetical protein
MIVQMESSMEHQSVRQLVHQTAVLLDYLMAHLTADQMAVQREHWRVHQLAHLKVLEMV